MTLPHFANSALQLTRRSLRNLQIGSYAYLSTLHADVSSELKSYGDSKPFIDMSLKSLSKEDIKLVLQPYAYVTTVPIKETRTALIDSFCYWMKLPSDLNDKIKQILHIVYQFMFMQDDIDDGSDYRRGLPTAHKLFGIPRTELSGRACLLLGVIKMAELHNTKVIEDFAEICLRYYAAQYRELNMLTSRTCPTIEEYEAVSIARCQPSMDLVFKIMQPFSKCKTDFSKLTERLSLHYQYLNDTANMCDQNIWDAKGFCEDIAAGKYTLAIVHAIQSGTPEGNIVSAIMQQTERDVPMRKYCLSLLKKIGSLDFAKQATLRVEKEVREEIRKLGGNPYIEDYLEKSSSWNYDEKAVQSYLLDQRS